MNAASKPSKFGMEMILLLLKSILFLFLIAVAYILFDIAREGFNSSLGSMFESEPIEGWQYWKGKEIKESLPEWIIAGFVAFAVLGTLAWSMIRSIQRIRLSVPNSLQTK
jgi:hypothetical protein